MKQALFPKYNKVNICNYVISLGLKYNKSVYLYNLLTFIFNKFRLQLIQKHQPIFLNCIIKFIHTIYYLKKLIKKVTSLMLNKLKNTMTNIMDEKLGEHAQAQPVLKKIQVPILSGKQIEIYRKVLDRFKENVQTIDQIAQNNKQDFQQFVKQRAKQAATSKEKADQSGGQQQNSQDKIYTLEQDMKEIKDALFEIDAQIKQVLTLDQQILAKVNQFNEGSGNISTAQTKMNQELLTKYETEIATLKKSQQNNKQILNTLGQQSQLYMKQMRELQQKCQKMQKQLNQKTSLINNLKQQKNVLLQMRNTSTANQLPQVQALKIKLTEFQKRLNLQRAKVETKEKQIEGLKKKMEEQHQSLQKIADQLKQKQLKSKKIIDKYQRSKTQIRKFREQKTQFIKQLNMEVARMSQQLAQQKKKNQVLTDQSIKLKQEIQNLKSEVSKNQNRKLQLESSNTELIEVRKQLHQKNLFIEQQQQQIKKIKDLNDQLQHKRKQLLQTLADPRKHEMQSLQKILRALDKLYKQYITTVFQEGNIVGFQSRITYIISNVQDLKEDLLL